MLCKIYRKAVSLKELEQRVAMEELARASATPSSHNTGSPADDSTTMSSSSSDHHQQQQQQAAAMTTMMMGITPAARSGICGGMKKEVPDSS